MTEQQRCNQELLTLYHYRELPAEQAAAVTAHLQGCAACRKALAELQQLLAQLPRPELQFSAADKQRFADRVARRARRRSGLPLPAWGGALAAAGALGLALVVMQPERPVVTPPAGGAAMADFEVIEQLDMLQELDLLQNLELLQELEQLG